MRRILFLLAILAPCAALAATPPALINYQGVLRSASDAPLTGSYDMVFRFMSASTLGDEILVDQHTSAAGGAVAVSGGLFNVQLGSGAVSDGSGPGVYTSLANVFRDYGTVWLQITVGGETLTPNTRIVAAGYALNASNLNGLASSNFLDVSSSIQAKMGKLIAGAATGTSYNVGLEGYGTDAGGYFKANGGTGFSYLGASGFGIESFGGSAGGWFQDTSGTGYAYVGAPSYGIYSSGSTAGGYFFSMGGSGVAYLGNGNRGIDARGNDMGGFFQDINSSGVAYVAYGDRGIDAHGSEMGGHFGNGGATQVSLATSTEGVVASATATGGDFHDSNTGSNAYLAQNSVGVRGIGASFGVEGESTNIGGLFLDSSASGYAYVGYGDRGIWGKGLFAGATFSHPDNVTFWADVSTPTYKIKGTGSMAFVQNDPEDPTKVIIYNAAEGDEVATYTRGSARLAGGVARIPLEKTFALVTNPDLGLTAHLTPRGEAASLYIESLSTKELVVRAGAGSPSDAAFDYLVYGLRIGFENEAVIQAKDREAPLPPAGAFKAKLQAAPEARPLTSLERFKGMTAAVRGIVPAALDLGGAAALEASIAAAGSQGIGRVDPRAERPDEQSSASIRPASKPAPASGATSSPPAGATTTETASGDVASPAAPAPAPAETAAGLSVLPVSEAVEAGDLLALDPVHPGLLHLATSATDPTVVGIAAVTSSAADGVMKVALVDSRFALLRVDAGYGEIQAGDLLTSSPTPGRAMRTLDPLPGTVIGKALEPLSAGLGIIRVVVMDR